MKRLSFSSKYVLRKNEVIMRYLKKEEEKAKAIRVSDQLLKQKADTGSR